MVQKDSMDSPYVHWLVGLFTGIETMAFKPQPVAFGPYRQWREAFDNEKVYTRRDLAQALHEKDRVMTNAMQILGVKQLLPNDYEMMMQIIRVERSPEGIFIVVR